MKYNVKHRRLGEEWAMSEVGIPPTYNLDNHPVMVAIPNNNSVG